MEISSLTNSKVKYWVKLKEKKHRDINKQFIVEGPHLVEEAYNAGLLEDIVILNTLTHKYNVNTTYYVTKEILSKIGFTNSGYDIIGICSYKDSSIDNSDIIVLDNLQDPGNIGTIIRTAYSFGYNNIVLSNYSVDIYNDKVIRSTQGALFNMNIIYSDLLSFIKDNKLNYDILVTNLNDSSISLEEYNKDKNVIIVFGNEGSGVSTDIINLADYNIKIDMNRFESLNVAIAAGICLYKLK